MDREIRILIIDSIIEIKKKENNFNSEKWNFIKQHLKKDDASFRKFLFFKTNKDLVDYYKLILKTFYTWR